MREIFLYPKAYIWILIAVLVVFAAVELKDMLIFFLRRIRFLVRLKKSGCEIEGCYPLWWLIPLSGKTSFFVRAKSGELFAVKLVGNYYPGTQYALTSTERWCRARWIMMMRLTFCLGFRRMLHRMDFRFDAEIRHKDAAFVWLFTPPPFRLTDRPEENLHKCREYTTGVFYDGILVADGNTFFSMLMREELSLDRV